MTTATSTGTTRLASPGERLAITLLFLANGFCIGAWAASIPALKLKYELDDGSLSLILLAFAVGAVVTMPIAGLLVARIGAGQTSRCASLAFSMSLVVPFMAPDAASLAIAALIAGGANGLMDVSMNAHASRVEARWGSAVMSSFHAAFSAGGLAGAALAAALALLAWEPAVLLQLAAIAGLAITVMVWKTVGKGEVAHAGSSLALPGRRALPLCAGVALCFVCEGAVADWSGVYLASVAGAGASVAASGYAAFSATMLLGRLTGDWLVNHFGGVRIIWFGSVMASIGLVLVAAVPAPAAVAVGFGLVGLGLANIVPVVFAAAGRLGASSGAGIAMAATAGYAGLLGGPPLVGAVSSLFGLRASMVLLAIGAGCILLSAGSVKAQEAAKT